MMLKTSSHRILCAFLTVAGMSGQSTLADSRTYQATTDFPVIDAGEAPYYSEVPDRPSLAINAAIEAYRDVFARAEVVYDGGEGVHDLTLVGLAELDGEAQYRIYVNDVLVGEATNPEVSLDYTVVRHSFENVNIPNGATIAVESLANTNGKIPEGNGTAFARGRWTALELLESDAEVTPPPSDIDLGIAISSSEQSLERNETFDIELTVSNAANSLVATQPIVDLSIALSVVDVLSAEQCTQDTLGLICNFPEIAAGDSHTMTLTFSTKEELLILVLQAIVEADQRDRDETNNFTRINVSIVDEEFEAEPEPEPRDPIDNTPDNNTNASNGSGGGSLSLFWLLLAIPARFREMRKNQSVTS
ncbi:MAG: hypothetical protein AB8B84_12220 [Granulosicoccus sp.]